MSDYVLQLKVKNGPMLRAMRSAGFFTALALSKASDVEPSRIGEYLNLKLAPMTESGDWRKSVIKLSETLKCLPEDMFPPQHLRRGLKRNVAEVDMSANDVAVLMDWGGNDQVALPDSNLENEDRQKAINECLMSLTPREQRVVALRYGLTNCGEKTLEQVAKQFGVSRDRIRQIEMKAIKKMKSPIRSQKLKDAGCLDWVA